MGRHTFSRFALGTALVLGTMAYATPSFALSYHTTTLDIANTQTLRADIEDMVERRIQRLLERLASIREDLNINASTTTVRLRATVNTADGQSSSSATTEILLTPTSASSSSSSAQRESVPRESDAQAVFRLVNEERAKRDLPPYVYNNILEQSAEDYAEHMRRTDCFSHTDCGTTLRQRMHDSGYYQGGGKSYSYGENIARGQESAAEVMRDWMNSPSHRDAILSTKYLEIGIGRSGEYWVQHFGAIRE